eukprot:TRINITY_DN19855_c0_g1_i1.p1 TRINITY_DN19855_c0_g1~~TRINITY_DN19855_c0_g1_i1.p1  ORF type:complete len:197 (+),score=29.77 TRINITY_DN19855_c0_g1_i1:238-828(+)
MQCKELLLRHGSPGMVIGPGGCGKSTVLWSAALDVARGGQDVIWVCDGEKISRNPPQPPPGAEWAREAMQRVHMKYVRSANELLGFLVGLPLLAVRPRLLVLDDTDEILSRCDDSTINKVLAMLHQTSERTDSEGGVLHVLLSDQTSNNGVSRLTYAPRWFPFSFTLRGPVCEGITCVSLRMHGLIEQCSIKLEAW